MEGAWAFQADDETATVLSYNGEEESEAVGVDIGDLEQEAESAQRLAVARVARRHVVGRMPLVMVDEERKLVPERMFEARRLLEWTSGDPEVVVRALREGRVRARLQAAAGLGKSTKLAPYVAAEMDWRVLMVSNDAVCLAQTARFLRRTGQGKFSRTWSEKPGSRVCCMTYGDFIANVSGMHRAEVFKCHELVIFDEAFMAESEVYVAKKLFAAYATPEVNLLLCSATIKAGPDAGSGASAALGAFRVLEIPVSVDEALDSGKLVGDYLVDRTMVFVPGDAWVRELLAHYQSFGVEVMSLDTAADSVMVDEVNAWLEGDSVTPRVVVATIDWGIGHNFAIDYEIIFPRRMCYRVEGERLIEETVPLPQDMVTQVQWRTGRGFGHSSGGIVCSNEVASAVALYESEVVKAFVQLSAAGVVPLRSGFWEKAYALFPKGLSPSIALSLLKICLPVEVAARFLGADGRVAKKFLQPVTMFCHPDHFLHASDSELPASYATWVMEPAGAYAGGRSALGVTLRVPFEAKGEMRVVLHAIAAVAEGYMSLSRWRPQGGLRYDDGLDSSDERADVKTRLRPLRRVEDRALPVATVLKKADEPWSYQDVTCSPQPVVRQKRYGSVVDKGRFREAMQSLELLLPCYEKPSPEAISVVSPSGEAVVEVEIAPDGNVESPGGSTICALPERMCQKLNMGEALSGVEVVIMVSRVKAMFGRFASSKLFDCFAGPWDAFLDALVDPDVLAYVVRSGYYVDTYTLVDTLRARFSAELLAVLARSNVFKRRYLGLFKKTPSTDSLMRAIAQGKFDKVAQTDAFIRRVKEIKTKIDFVLLKAESQGVYLPTYITSAQRALPLRGHAPLGVVGQGIVPMPSAAAGRVGSTRYDKAKLDRRFERVGF